MIRKPIVVLAVIVAVSITGVLLSTYNPDPGSAASRIRRPATFIMKPPGQGEEIRQIGGGKETEPEDGGNEEVLAAPDDLEAAQASCPIGGWPPVGAGDCSLAPGGIAAIAVCTGDGRPVLAATVLLAGNPAEEASRTEITDFAGLSVFDGLGEASFIALAGSHGFAPGGVALDASEESMSREEIVLPPAGSLCVVVRGVNGTPLSGAHVAVTGYSLFGIDAAGLTGFGLLTASDPRFLTDWNGVFSLDGLPPGRIGLNVKSAGRSYSTEIQIIARRENRIQVSLR